jgi:hypothetical protein
MLLTMRRVRATSRRDESGVRTPEKRTAQCIIHSARAGSLVPR